MKTLKFKDQTIVSLIKEQGLLVEKGRGFSNQIEQIEKRITELDTLEKEYTTKCEPKALIEKGDAIYKKIQELSKELAVIGKEIEETKIASIPIDMYNEHYALRDKKEKLERERNKVALKIQKMKDKLIPKIQKLVKPHLEEYEDIEKSDIKNNELIVYIYNRLEEFKNNFKKG